LKPSKVVLMPDGDDAGIEGANRSVKKLREVSYNGPIMCGEVPMGHDPCSMGRDACAVMIRSAREVM
jgi:DNA primase